VAARVNKTRQKQGVSTSIEMLDAFRYGKINRLIFLDLLANELSASMKSSEFKGVFRLNRNA